MRNISFMLTTEQVRARTKDVTRRDGWLFAKVGDVYRAVEKSQGLGKGGKIKPICLIGLVDVRREPLRAMLDDVNYGRAECVREGFPDMTPAAFVEFFCKSHRGVTPGTFITRLEFDYPDEATNG